MQINVKYIKAQVAIFFLIFNVLLIAQDRPYNTMAVLVFENENSKGEWRKVTVIVDSGAGENVAPRDTFPQT